MSDGLQVAAALRAKAAEMSAQYPPKDTPGAAVQHAAAIARLEKAADLHEEGARRGASR